MVSKLKVLWAVSFPRCTVAPTMGNIVASVCIPLPTRMQQLPTMLAQQLLSVVASVFTLCNSSSLYKEWEWINGFQKVKKISLLVTTTQRLWNWIAIWLSELLDCLVIFQRRKYKKNKSRDLIWVEDSYMKQSFTLIDRYESHLLSTE